MKTKVYEATGTTLDDAVYNAMQLRWCDENYAEAEVIDSKLVTFMDTSPEHDGYVPKMHYKVWVRDA